MHRAHQSLDDYEQKNRSYVSKQNKQDKLTKVKGSIDGSLCGSHVTKRKHNGTIKSDLIEQHKRGMENARLIKKLSQISCRKNRFFEAQKSSNQYCTINLKSREYYRLQRKKQIQEENNHFVQRMVKRLSSHKSIFGDSYDTNHQIKKHRKKKKQKDVFTLPSIH